MVGHPSDGLALHLGMLVTLGMYFVHPACKGRCQKGMFYYIIRMCGAGEKAQWLGALVTPLLSGIAPGHFTLCQGLVRGFCKENCGLIGARESGKNSEGEGRQSVGEVCGGWRVAPAEESQGHHLHMITASGR